MAGAFDAKVDISTKEARDGLIGLRKEVKGTAEMLTVLDTALKASSKDLKTTAESLTKIVAASRAAATATKETAQADIAAARASGIRATADAKVSETLARKANQEAQAARATSQSGLASARVTDIEARRTMATDRVAAATLRAANAQTNMHDSMSNSRYLMYDVGATYGVLAAGLMAIPAATAAVASAYQKDFAQVVRVNEEFQQNTVAANQMKESLKGIATDIPVAFGELSRITQLGAQMGVADDKLSDFTETTAKFVAVTGISADAGSTLFGRLESSFTDDVQQFPDFFERVGSSIAYVGAKTVATDPEIASMLNQIGPLGAAAGMSAAEVTGLAAALASVRVQPELARGTLTRIFGQINRDVAEGSPRLAEYGKLMGLTGAQAGKLWQTDSSKFFTDLVAGLNAAQLKNGELTTTLDKLGINASRDVSALTKLAVGNDVLVKSMDAANQGFAEGTALGEMSKPVFETIVAHLTEMANAWKNLGDTLGSGALAPLGMFVDMAKNIAIGLDSISKNADGTISIIGRLIQGLMAIATVTAVFLGFKAAQAFVMAGMIGFQQAAARGMGGGLALGNQVRTLAQTMLVAKGATDQQSRAMLNQVSASRALMIASATTSAQIRNGTAGSFGVLATATGKATGGIKGVGSAMLGMAGGPIGIAVGALAILAGGFLNAQVQAEQSGKAIAEAMQKGGEAGRRAIAEQLNDRKVQLSPTEGDISFSKLGQSVTEVAKQVDVKFDDIVNAVQGGTDSAAAFQKKMQELQKGTGLDKFKSDAYGWLGRVATEMANSEKNAADGLKAVEKAAPLAGKGLQDLGDDSEDVPPAIDKITKALKDLNDEVFGTINNESALQGALAKIGEGLQKSQSYSPTSEGGRDNIANVQDALAKAREYYNQLKTTDQMTAQQAAEGYAQFSEGLMSEIKNKYGGDTSYIEQLAATASAKFTAIIGGQPVSVPVDVDPAQVQTMAVKANATIKDFILAQGIPQIPVNVATDNAQSQTLRLVTWLSEITHLPYKVVLDALTDPAAEKSEEIYKLITSITDGTYTAPIDADTSAAVTNVKNFSDYARNELANIQYAMRGLGEGGVGLDTFGMAAAKKKYAGLIVPTSTAAPTQVRAKSAAAPTLGASKTGLGGIADGFNKAAEAAKKAGKSAKDAAKDIASGITDAVKAAEDYGNRLKTALMSSYNQQYALTSATDAYHSALNAINKKREDEIEQVQTLRDKIRELNDERDKELITAAKAKIEQGISLKYGETARAADYGNQAKTSLDNAAAKQKEIDAAGKEATTIQNGIGLLTGYSDAAIANREALRNLETKMIDMVAAYATTGHSVDEVRRYAQGLTAQYQIDVGQMGLNQIAVGNLQGSFERYIDTINRVPQFVPTVVDADTDAAQQEVAAYGDALDGIEVPRTGHLEITIGQEFQDFLDKKGKYATLNDIDGLTFRPGNTLRVPGLTGGFTGGNVGDLMGMYSGGMVPGTPPSDPRADNKLARVDGKGLIKIRSREFIQPEEAVNYYGPDFMEAVRTMSLPKFNMGGSPSGSRGAGAALSVSDVVELGASTLAALAEMRQEIRLFADSRELASSVNSGNRQLVAEGHRS